MDFKTLATITSIISIVFLSVGMLFLATSGGKIVFISGVFLWGMNLLSASKSNSKH